MERAIEHDQGGARACTWSELVFAEQAGGSAAAAACAPSFDLEMMERGRLLQRASRTTPGTSTRRTPRARPPHVPVRLPAARRVAGGHRRVARDRAAGGRHVQGRRARARSTLVERSGSGCRAALDNRPLKFEEWEERAPSCQKVYVSATPGPYEIRAVERWKSPSWWCVPTGLIDPQMVEIKPGRQGQVDDLLVGNQRLRAGRWATACWSPR